MRHVAIGNARSWSASAMLVFLLVGVGCTSHSTSSTRFARSKQTRAKPLRVVPTPTPRFVVGLYNASGTYPQLHASDTLNLSPVNRSLREALAADQRQYVRGVR